MHQSSELSTNQLDGGNNIFHFPIESYVKTLSSRCGPIGQLRQLVFREQYKEQSYQGTIP
jgi:hypothetical protein